MTGARPYSERVLLIADKVEDVHGGYLPFSVRLAAARAADKTVMEWAAAREEDDR